MIVPALLALTVLVLSVRMRHVPFQVEQPSLIVAVAVTLSATSPFPSPFFLPLSYPLSLLSPLFLPFDLHCLCAILDNSCYTWCQGGAWTYHKGVDSEQECRQFTQCNWNQTLCDGMTGMKRDRETGSEMRKHEEEQEESDEISSILC